MNGTTRLAAVVANTVAKSPILAPKSKAKTSSVSAFSTGKRLATTTTSGAYFQEPAKVPMGISGVAATITTGLLLGAGISKNIASFLEENELFVPSDDDDDD